LAVSEHEEAGVQVWELASQVSPVPEHTVSPQVQGTVVAAAVPVVVLHSAGVPMPPPHEQHMAEAEKSASSQ
jgi:hypothetical protein